MVSALPIYLDYQATTPTDPRVVRAMLPFFSESFGNPSSVDHQYGDAADDAVQSARAAVANLVCADSHEVVFTSGATEAANLAIVGWAREFGRTGSRTARIGLSPVEHLAVMETCKYLEETGQAQLIYFDVDRHGQLNLEDFRKRCTSGLDLVCVMLANNELGTVYPLQLISALAHHHNTMVFTDATQGAGRLPCSHPCWGADLLALSAHKIYGPKGVGALIVRRGSKIRPVLFGGGQEQSLRPGTLNTSGIVGFGEAARLRTLEMEEDERRTTALRDLLEQLILEQVPEAVVNGDRDNRLAGSLHLSFPHVPNQAVTARLREHIAISTGSACRSGIEAPSHVLRAISLPDELARGSLRVSLGKFTTEKEVRTAAQLLTDAVHDVQRALLSV
jgi:cysteine desulfurase